MRMQRVALATKNAGKIREITASLEPLGVEILNPGNFGKIAEVPETGVTFAENALLKAAAVCQATGIVSIADDSGLVVRALAGAPGIFSARYAADWPALENETRDQRNIRKLLANLVSHTDRSAYFETCLAVVAPNGRQLLVSGRWEGEILLAPRGTNGFGYDPVFFDPMQKKTAAELSLAEKNAVSHRGNAIRALAAAWPDFAASLI